MTPELRKAALNGMVTLAYNHTRGLIQEYEKIKKAVAEINTHAGDTRTIVRQTATQILEELETRDHMGKLQLICARLGDLRNAMNTATVDADFSIIFAQMEADLDDVNSHFNDVIPLLHNKLKNVMQQQAELN